MQIICLIRDSLLEYKVSSLKLNNKANNLIFKWAKNLIDISPKRYMNDQWAFACKDPRKDAQKDAKHD